MHDSTQAPENGAKQFLLSILFNIPVVGWMLRDLTGGRESALGFFGANVLMLWLLAGLIFGIPGMLGGAYILLPLYALILLTIMRC